ncbi:DNA repair protein RecN [Winogradskyella maritima]|uniref:DNA repair protein RecN n=1 Tax=Winogradskyella maritima TaxID=1517766 RepID=A0ABV8ACD7_9FLAO|nr:DNA repair protein RecN [Winogradskyella maritima]
MLHSLSIKNYALIDELHVEFKEGLSIITGETGAGKSILLGGLSLVLGKRADLSQVKDKTNKCIIEAVFNVNGYTIKPVFEQYDLDYEPLTIIRREILPSGKSRAFVNDSPVNLESLGALSSYLLDIHSQHQTIQLVDDTYQFQVIDALANNSVLLTDFSEKLKNLKGLQQELIALQTEKANALKEHDYNAFLLKELTEAQLIPGELEDLEETYNQLSNVETISEKLNESQDILNADDLGVTERLNTVKRNLGSISGFSKTYELFYQRLESVIIELYDLSEDINNANDSLQLDPQEFQKVSDKLETVNGLLKKHIVSTTDELLEIQEALEQKVTATTHLDEKIEGISKDIVQLENELKTTGSTINKNRKVVVPNFIKELQTILSDLGMPNARFDIKIEKAEAFKFNGMDELQFMFTANKGSDFTELKKAASGGELSRIMLAIKSILANYIKLPTIMFDEIDTGVSGAISNKMASIMKTMSQKMQVFSITHLPQIAAKGDWHFKVFKTDVNDKTETQIEQLQYDQRIVEIAQMLAGSKVSESALVHAKELLN